MLERIKNKITENSGLVNMIINLAILYLLFTVASGIRSVDNKVTQIQQQTTAQIQPITDEEVLKRQIINTIISKLNEAK